MSFKALLVDDERLARQELRQLLAEYAVVQVIGEAQNLTEAISIIQSKKPDIVFLDIQLRNENGFALLDMVEHHFKLIFVTAFDEFAVRAFDINALDYLLKPVNPKRLKTTIDKLCQTPQQPQESLEKLCIEDQVFLNLGQHSRFIPIKQVSHICASGDYSQIFLRTVEGSSGKNADKRAQTLLVEKSLKEWQNRLPESCFTRIHRSTIINIKQIDAIQVLANRTMQLSLKNCSDVFTVSRRYASKFKQKFV